MKLGSLLIIFILFTGCMGNTKTIDEKLIGTWNGYLIDSMNGERIEQLTIEFTDKGEIIYTTGEGDMQYIITNTYRIKNGIIYSKNSDDKKEEKATYEIKGNKLIMVSEGISNEFLKKD
ncbi:hypothetical protein [Fusobacterium sp.]|uniref:hypothetical protein n=1 Tax=Fusobacterium sp. TaxID=68766 RepID=UPI00290536E7|nr:hypothetical protein [Fusobacterium sp.]MDU1911760.1 hypothetical protein [Fusobacterium sp.]